MNAHYDSQQCAAACGLRELLSCLDDMYMIEYFNYDELNFVIEELFTALLLFMIYLFVFSGMY